MKTMISEGPAEVIIHSIQPMYALLRKRFVALACSLVAVAGATGVILYPSMQKKNNINAIYEILDQNNSQTLDTREVQPLQDLHLTLPENTVQSEFQALLENKSPQDVQSILETLVNNK
ncbi:MAG: hypothetical protein Q8L34_00090 [Candidatus Woesearchaeota archaeon]|nr:hypothetical protein [Candidatus Woesearchaeota archaeon]